MSVCVVCIHSTHMYLIEILSPDFKTSKRFYTACFLFLSGRLISLSPGAFLLGVYVLAYGEIVVMFSP